MNLLDLLMGSAQSSLKVIGKTTGSMTISNSASASTSTTYAHGYGSDDLIIAGYVDSTYSNDPGEHFGYNLPYTDALGHNLAWVEWDSTNIYIKMNNQGNLVGSGTGTWTITYTVLIIVP